MFPFSPMAQSSAKRSHLPGALARPICSRATIVSLRVASDNLGAATLSPPVLITLIVPPAPATLQIAQLGTNVVLSWPTGNEAVVLQSTSNLAALSTWKNITNEVVALNESKAVTFGAPAPEQFFRLGPESRPFHPEPQAHDGLPGLVHLSQ